MILKLIQFIHLLLIIFLLVSPFLPVNYLAMGIALLLFIIKNWGKDNRCIFTILEYMILDKPSLEKGFIYRLINPVYDFTSEKDFDKLLNKIVYIWLILLIILFIYKGKKTNYFKNNY